MDPLHERINYDRLQNNAKTLPKGIFKTLTDSEEEIDHQGNLFLFECMSLLNSFY